MSHRRRSGIPRWHSDDHGSRTISNGPPLFVVGIRTVSSMGDRIVMPRVIETDRLLLRPWVEADAVLYRDLWSERDPRSLRVIDAVGRPTVEDLREKIRTELTEPDPTGLGLLVIERRAEKDFIGYCGLIHRDMTPEEPEIAYELLRRAHGCGYATEAAGAVRDAGRELGRSRLWAGVRSWNTASFRVLDKIGFTASGLVNEDPDHGNMVWMTCDLRPTASS